MPTSDSLDLAELDRLERESKAGPTTGYRARSLLSAAVYHQLRPLLDLVDRLGVALIGLEPTLDVVREPWAGQARVALDDYRWAKGEKPCEKCNGTGARHVAGEPVVSEACGECSGEGVVSA